MNPKKMFGLILVASLIFSTYLRALTHASQTLIIQVVDSTGSQVGYWTSLAFDSWRIED